MPKKFAKLRLDRRPGVPPLTGKYPPQLQYSDQSPRDVYSGLIKWAFTAYPGVREARSLISIHEARALWLDESVPAPAHVFMPPMGSREYAHTHPCGSMHLMLSEGDENTVLESGWGIRHPSYSRGYREMLVFAPRDFKELETIKSILDASYRHATGQATGLSDCTCADGRETCQVHTRPRTG